MAVTLFLFWMSVSVMCRIGQRCNSSGNEDKQTSSWTSYVTLSCCGMTFHNWHSARPSNCGNDLKSHIRSFRVELGLLSGWRNKYPERRSGRVNILCMVIMVGFSKEERIIAQSSHNVIVFCFIFSWPNCMAKSHTSCALPLQVVLDRLSAIDDWLSSLIPFNS